MRKTATNFLSAAVVACWVIAGFSAPALAKDPRDGFIAKSDKDRELRSEKERAPLRFQRFHEPKVDVRPDPKASPPDHGRRPPLINEHLRPDERADLRRQLRNQPPEPGDRSAPEARLTPDERRQLREHLIDIRRKRVEQMQLDRSGKETNPKSNNPNPYSP
jgi:hypothetical protein